MAKGRYNVSVADDSNQKKGGNNSDEAELENQECANSCLSPTFLRSLSFHDRPRSSLVPANNELRKSRYKTLVSTSLEKIPSNPLPLSQERSEYGAYNDFESTGIDAGVEMTTQSDLYQQMGLSQSSGSGNWFEDRYPRCSLESEKLLDKVIVTLRTLDKDISQSLINLTKAESIALESIIETYKNKGKRTADSSKIDSSTKTSSDPIYENLQSIGSKIDSTTKSSSDLIYENWQPIGSKIDSSTKTSSDPTYENWQPPMQQKSKDVQFHSTPQRTNDFQAQSSRQSPKDLQTPSTKQSPKNMLGQTPRQSPKNSQTPSTKQSPKNILGQSPQQSPKNLHGQSPPRNPESSQAHSAEQNPKNFLISSSKQTLKNLESLLNTSSGNVQSSPKTDSNNMHFNEQEATNVLPSSKMNTSDDSTEVKSFIEFDLPSDHEQFIRMVEALQSRCLEYRELIQDIAVLALEECLNFSQFSHRRIRDLRKQLESQKRNFRDFKELCCKSVVFGPDSLSIDEKVKELIQSFYLKLMQEENETFIARLELPLKMGEMYAKMQKFEIESKKIITTLENEILFLKKTSVGFKV